MKLQPAEKKIKLENYWKICKKKHDAWTKESAAIQKPAGEDTFDDEEKGRTKMKNKKRNAMVDEHLKDDGCWQTNQKYVW